MAFALKLASEVRAVLPTLSIDAQEDLWDLFEELAASPGVSPTADAEFEVEMHVFVRTGDARDVRLLFPLVFDYQSQSVMIPWLIPLLPA